MPKPLLYKHNKVVKLTEVQHQTLKKLEKYNVRVCDFIRVAIQEKTKMMMDILQILLKLKGVHY